MSGMLGQILGGLMGGGGVGGQGGALGPILRQVLGGGSGGGLGGLLSRFQSAGLGPQAQSWVGPGENQPISPDQVGQVFSPEQISSWASQAGTTPDAMRQVLAQALPHAVDQMTPGGQVPAQSADLSGLLGSLLGGGRRV